MATLLQRNTEGTYSFASQPKAIGGRSKYRNEDLNLQDGVKERYGNLMYDRRVIRGNTYAVRIAPASLESNVGARSLLTPKRRIRVHNERENYKLPPAQLSGRLHVPVQTEPYLEALTDKIDEAEVDCQTDAFLDRPVTPQFVPAKVGEDVETQIYEGELFDFDLEVIEVLEVLLGKTLEQALLEVAEEEELANLRAQQFAFDEIRDAELAEVQRVMEQDRRIRLEKEQCKAQHELAVVRQKELAAKVAAMAFAKAYLSELQPRVFDNLTDQGYFYDPVEYDVENGFIPWLIEEIDEELQLENRARALLDLMIREVVMEKYNEYHQLDLMDEQRAKEKLEKQEMEKRKEEKPKQPETLPSAEPELEQTKEAEQEEQTLERDMSSLDEVDEAEEKEEPTENTEEVE